MSTDRARALASAQRELARKKFSAFVKRLWPVVEPETTLEWGWPYDVLCDHLQAVTEGKIQNLLINVPPRFLKSTITSVLWPAWEWLEQPGLSYLTGSYDGDLAVRDAVKARRVMRAPEYRALLRPEKAWRFAGDQDVKSRYENDRGGTRITCSTTSKLTGFGGQRIIVDDAHNAMEAPNAESLRQVRDWHDQGLSTRANDYRSVRRVLVGQRLAPDDLSGHVLDRGGYTHVCLPLVYEQDYPYRVPTPLGFVDPRKAEGEALMPARYPPAVLAQLKRTMQGGWYGQMQQRPVPAGGAIFQRPWFQFYNDLPGRFDSQLISADLAFKGTSKEELERVRELSYVVIDRWGFVGLNAYLVDEVRGQWDFAETLRQFIAFVHRHANADETLLPMGPLDRKLIEAKANGPALVSILRNAIPGLEEVEPNGSKIQRAYAVQPHVEQGRVFLPAAQPWVTSAQHDNDLCWLDEVCQFPFAARKKNDRVDCLTQALQHARILEGDAVLKRLEALAAW